ncbi:hypothetical protein [Photobacterium sanguinicancri]|uniref:VanZ-like domain-containing protein n=1 Tax=Photobacterium sanguinicancri TaxID=875932 RepID=A0AAW7Y0E3_9GAMM|nr:hypothetical protein [Photobacterium sanguinicancri]MDO6542046.1 hypothetical protein [Photobacterium sanguinicancri]
MRSYWLAPQFKLLKIYIAWGAFSCYFVFITLISLSAGAETDSLLDLKQYGILFLDKLLHLGAYGLYVILASQLGLSFHKFISLCIGLSAYGLFLEFCQGQFILNREASWLDAIANVMGVVIGFMLFYKSARRNK